MIVKVQKIEDMFMKFDLKTGKIMNCCILMKKCFYYIIMLFFIGIYIWMVKSHNEGSICIASGSFVIISFFYFFAFVIISMRQCGEKLKKKYQILRYSNVFVFFTLPLLAFYIVEVIYNPIFSTMPFIKVLINYFMFLGLQVGIYLLTQKSRFAYCSILVFALIFGVANYYVLQFKGNPLLPVELFSYKTAMAVVGNYRFELSDSIIYGYLLFLYGLCIIKCLGSVKNTYSVKRKISMFILGLGYVYIVAGLLFNIKWSEILNIGITNDACR